MTKLTGQAIAKGFLTASLMVSAAWFAIPNQASATSIKETVRAAVETNPDVGVVAADRRAVDQELRQARGGLLPSIDIRAAAGGEYTDSPTTRNTVDGDNSLLRNEAQLTLTQLLFDGYETASEIARQRSRVDSAAYRVEEAAEFVALDSIEAHLDVLRNDAIVALNQANIAAHQKIFDQVADLEESGAGDIADVRQTEARLATARENLAVSEGALADANASYIRAVGMAPVALERGSAPVSALPADSEDAAAIASTQSPTVKIAAADVDVSSAEARGSRSNYYPRFDLEVGATAADDVDGVKGSNYGASALVVMRYNLYRGGADKAREREAFHRTNESRARLRQIRRTAEQEARVSYNALDTARARTAALRDRVEAQRRTRDAYGSQFEIGQRDLLDLLDSENELLLARVSLTTAEFTELFAAYRVLAVVGSLMETIDLVRPRESISINRRVEDIQSPEAIEEKSIEVDNPHSEPRPVRGQDAGEPPLEQPDASDAINRSELGPIGDQTKLASTGDAKIIEAKIIDAKIIDTQTGEPTVTASFAPASIIASIEPEAEPLNKGDSVAKAFNAFLANLFDGPAKKPEPMTALVDASAPAVEPHNDIALIASFLDEIAAK